MSAREAATVPVAADVIAAVVDLLGSAAQRERAAERRGYARGHAAGYGQGYRRGRQDEDDAWFGALAPAREASRRLASTPARAHVETRRWGPGGRELYGKPQPDDYPGGPLPLEHPGEVWLGGSPVHNVPGCTTACRSYTKGWYRPSEAIKILGRLPHDYHEMIGELREMAGAA